MGKDRNCEIVLENHTGYFTSGSEVKGQIRYKFAEPISPKVISIHLFCTEANEWTETTRQGNRTDFTTYSGCSNVIHKGALVYRAKSSSDVIPPGSRVYNFALTLPRILPSSYIGPYGYVRYRLIAFIPGFKKYDYTTFFTVLSAINLASLAPSYFEPTGFNNEKTVCCWCCSRGQVSIEANFPKLGFILGEKIAISVRLSNNSNSTVKALQVKLEQVYRYKVDRPSTKQRETSNVMLTFQKSGVEAKGQHTYDLELIIPKHLETPNFIFCKYFQVNYKLTITAQMGALTRNVSITCFPQLGHINVAGNTNTILANPGDYYLPTTETIPGSSDDVEMSQPLPEGIHLFDYSNNPSEEYPPAYKNIQ